MSNTHLIADPSDALAFVYGGKARFTLVSKATGKRYTYRMAKSKDDTLGLFFASVLTGPNNDTDYKYIGYTRGEGLKYGQRGDPFSSAYKALAWALARLHAGLMPAELAFWHEGRCAMCARPLTDPVSIARGLGPECATK